MRWVSASVSHAAPLRTGRAAWPRRPSDPPPSPAPGLDQVRCYSAQSSGTETAGRAAGSQSLKKAETTRQNRPICWHPMYMAAAPVVVPQVCAHRKG